MYISCVLEYEVVNSSVISLSIWRTRSGIDVMSLHVCTYRLHKDRRYTYMCMYVYVYIEMYMCTYMMG